MTDLILALDFSDERSLFHFVDPILPEECILKIGLEAYIRLGSQIITRLVDRGFRIFLDLKFHDIPNTVSAACSACADLGVWMINVHALSGERVLSAASHALSQFKQRPLLVGVTILTSMEAIDLNKIGIYSSVETQVLCLSDLCKKNGLDGVVCSAFEVPGVKKQNGDSFLTVTPGIRLASDPVLDQRRVVMPKEAVTLGSDYIVMGRSITAAPDPQYQIKSVLKELE